jgi:hypothetical protein
MLKFPVFDTAPTITFICRYRNILQSLAMVLVLPHPGGPLMKVNPFCAHFDSA